MGEVLAATNRPLIVAGGTRRTIRAWPSLPARAGETPAGRADHAAAEEGVRFRDIAEAIGRGLKIPAVSISPEEAPAHFGWMSIDYFADCSQLNERLMSGGLKKVSTRA